MTEVPHYRLYGKAPATVAVLHGGPGAPGSVAPLAKALSERFSVLEPMQRANTLQGQVDELTVLLKSHTQIPVTLVGWSWGAILGFLVAAQFPKLVKKLILVGSASFDANQAKKIHPTRMERMNAHDRQEFDCLVGLLEGGSDDREVFAVFGSLLDRIDSYRPTGIEPLEFAPDQGVFESVWAEAAALRASGALLEMGKSITCPVVAIHGDYDPHPTAGVVEPLQPVLKDFTWIELQHCGHSPWYEREAKETFYRVLEEHLSN